MRAWEINQEFGIEQLHCIERPDPQPGPHQICIRVKATSLNYRDLMTVKHGGLRGLKQPLIPLSDGAGEVVAVGEGVSRVKTGDRVAGIFFQSWLSGGPKASHGQSALGGALDGMWAEYVVLDEDGVVRLPDYMSYEDAATLPCAAVTAWQDLVSVGRIKAGDTVLVMGTGGVSIFALQFAKAAGAQVIITSSSDAKLERAKQLGADHLINYKTTPEWGKAALDITDGVGVDHVVEVGGAGTLGQSFQATRVGGFIGLIGVLSGFAGETNPMPILQKSIQLQGIYVGSRDMFEDMNAAMTINHTQPVIDQVFPFEHAQDALRCMESAGHFGKIVVTG